MLDVGGEVIHQTRPKLFLEESAGGSCVMLFLVHGKSCTIQICTSEVSLRNFKYYCYFEVNGLKLGTQNLRCTDFCIQKQCVSRPNCIQKVRCSIDAIRPGCYSRNFLSIADLFHSIIQPFDIKGLALHNSIIILDSFLEWWNLRQYIKFELVIYQEWTEVMQGQLQIWTE